MDSNQLLNRMKDRDMEAYHHMTEKYGWKLYSYLKTRFHTKEQVDAALNETLHQFYNTIAGSEDIMEALLFSFADRTCQTMMQGENSLTSTVPRRKSNQKTGAILFAIAIALLLLGIFMSIWVIVGLLMGLGIMPELDLGYSWFNEYIFPWF